ncbi:MAG TPA: hypothetical protein VK429_08940 [Patescibacteria group bacterium]|nr:hypothetical protein [Patescibacteria group bacterium]
METTTFRTQYKKFRMLTARFFSYWFFVIFATIGVAIAVMERFTNVLGVQHLEPLMILILTYAILVYIVTERAKVLDDIHENLRSAKAEVYPTRESVYMAVPLIIARASADGHGRRRIFHAALHGLGGKRLAKPSRPDPVFEVFEGAIDRCVASTGPGMWHVYEIYNIPDEERLDVLVELIGKRQHAEGYEVRAFAHAGGIPHLSPLVIGDEDLVVGVDDPRYYRASSAIHLRGRDPVRLATEYFYSLWNDPRIRVLKTETGVNRDGIETLREEFRASERMGESPPAA